MKLEDAARSALPACPVCGGHTWSPPRAPTRLRWCSSCGVVWNDRSPSREAEESRYEDYSHQPGSEWLETEGWKVGCSQWEWVRREFCQPDPGAERAVLDIGCGHGAFLRRAREDGVRVAGVELDPQGVAACRAAGLDVRAGSLFDTGVPDGPWDLVTFWDVLEHLDDPAAALRQVAPVVKPGGAVVVRGRNARLHAPFKVACQRARSTASALRMPDLSCVHRWGFGPDHYRVLLLAAGFQGLELYPGLPTPGDRSRTLGTRGARVVKGAIEVVGMTLSGLSIGRLYPFPSVLISARKSS